MTSTTGSSPSADESLHLQSGFEAFVRASTDDLLHVWLHGLQFEVPRGDVAEVRAADAASPAGWTCLHLRVDPGGKVQNVRGAPDPEEFIDREEPFAFSTRSKWPLARPHPEYRRLERAYRERHGLDAAP